MELSNINLDTDKGFQSPERKRRELQGPSLTLRALIQRFGVLSKLFFNEYYVAGPCSQRRNQAQASACIWALNSCGAS